jgi:multiple antibiotic resistance protein
MSGFIYTFIPIFVAMDIGGNIPVFLSLTKGLTDEERNRVNLQAVITAFLISAVFITIGRFIFRVLGISAADFEIAGGALLLVFSIVEMLHIGGEKRVPSAHVGPVPLGTPLIVGPAVLTSLLILIGLRGYFVTFTALSANLLLVGLCFWQSRQVIRAVGEDGLKAISQVVSLFLAAIAVSMIRRGIQSLH